MKIKIVEQKREFGCALSIVKTVILSKYHMPVRNITKHFWYFESIGTLNFQGGANQVLRAYNLPGKFVKKTNVRFGELVDWLHQEYPIIVLFVSRENYPHYGIISDIDEERKIITIANTHGGVFDEFTITEFLERLYLNPRYIQKIQWRNGHSYPITDFFIRNGVRLLKSIGIIKPATVYYLRPY